MSDATPQPEPASTKQAAIAKARRMIAEGADQLERGEGVDGEAVMRRLREKHQRLLDDEQAKSA